MFKFSTLFKLNQPTQIANAAKRNNFGSLATSFAILLTTLVVPTLAIAQNEGAAKTEHVEGLIESKPQTFAIVGATIHVSPTKSIENGTIVIRNGKFEAVGADVPVPADARTIDAVGKQIYAGFVESYLPVDIESEEETGTAYWNKNIRSQMNVAEQIKPEMIEFKKMREAGFTSALVVPKNGILKGVSSFMLLADAEPESLILKDQVAQHARLTASRGSGGYPNSPMGAVALARQTFLDAQWYQKAHRVSRVDPKIAVPETNRSLAALKPVIDGEMPLFVETSNELFVLRADRFAREFDARLIVRGSGNEYRRLDAIAEIGKPFVVPVDFPSPPKVSDPNAAIDVTLEQLMHWDHAPENPGRLAKAGTTIALTSEGMEKRSEFLEQVRIAVQRGLDPEVALAAITTTPAKLYQVQDQIGSIEPGKIASLVMMDKPLFTPKSKIVETWVAGRRYPATPKSPRKPTGDWTIESDVDQLNGRRLSITGTKKLTASIAINTDIKPDAKPESVIEPNADDDASEKEDQPAEKKSVAIKSLAQQGPRISGVFDGSDLGWKGMHRFSLVFVEPTKAIGQLVSANGAVTTLIAKRTDDESPSDDESEKGSEKPASETDSKKPNDSDKPKSAGHNHAGKMASYDVNFPLGSFGRSSVPETAKKTLIVDATVWTCGEKGIIENGTVMIDDGKIVGVFGGEDVLPEADTIINGTGMHLTPGIIDCHSHMATDSGINESGQVVTAEVRIGDLIDCDDINIFRQLAGGVTCVNILHGSANPIGGQNQVIKLRWGALDEEMKFAEAPAGIKFALGENVKRSRDPSSTRYPKTRMGVEQLFHDRFRAAIEYRQQWKRYEANRQGLPPRVDLELETIAEIVEGERWIHCHSYRQDEILALLRVLEEYEIKIGSLQHILEGYKVAEAMQKHGAMASSFADWWAYKFEVRDAIPYNGALMHNAGIVVSFNSDDRELARHLNHEAAKAVKYGGVSEEEALKFVTLNPAKQLRIDQYTGSIEKGKDADLVLWNGPPLSPRTRCQQTWVDGKNYFDFEQIAFEGQLYSGMKNKLVQKILASGKGTKSSGGNVDPASLWPRHDEFCHGDDKHDH